VHRSEEFREGKPWVVSEMCVDRKWRTIAFPPAVCLWYAYYNFCRIHKTLRVTPAMESKLTDHVWDLAELLA
jgi:hypothetical protein